ncbi:MAG TPA: hypothetical protein VFE30_00195 [Anaeromyxobacteraceae bacterium]|jgi:hypothetical protein|nr:hypothetical protein [Anaeromyxobacteraceae bacterium]
MRINTPKPRVASRWLLFVTGVAGLVAAVGWNGRAGSAEVTQLAALTHASALADGAYGSCEALPPGHPPIGQLLPPGHPPVGEAPDEAAPALPPGHPPVGPAPQQLLPPAHPPVGGEHGGPLFEEPAMRDI